MYTKLTLLLWKNWILLRRHCKRIFCVLLMVAVILILIIFPRIVIYPIKHDAIYFPPFNVSEAMMDYSKYTLVYSPFNINLQKIVINTLKALKMNPSMKGTVLANSKEMNLYFRDDEVLKDVLAGIQFDDFLGENSYLPKNITVTLRFPASLRSENEVEPRKSWATDWLFPLFSMPGPRSHKSKTAPPDYYKEGFLAIQKTLTFHIIKHFNKSFKEPEISMARYPYPKWSADPLIQIINRTFGIWVLLIFVLICIYIILVLAKEKETQLKETMKIMGLSSCLSWTAWFITLFIPLLILVILIVIIFTEPIQSGFGLLTYTNPYVLFVFLFIYIWPVILFMFAISVFFTKAFTTKIVILLVFLMDILLSQYILNTYNYLKFIAKLLSCLLCNTGLQIGFYLMFMFESTGEGLQWSNINKTATPDDDLTLLHIMIMLIIDSIIYLLIIVYVEAVFPGEYGVARVWYFPCTLSYWQGQHTSADMVNYNESSLNQDPNIYEKEPDNLQIGIQVIHLSKMYSNKQLAVKDLSLNMFEGQITVLLGENGAGKTTTMLMLTGMFSPTSGTAIVRGYDIRIEMDKVRKSLGICPQHNILFDELTVEEHIYFYCTLKGLEKSEIQNEINKYIHVLELGQKSNVKPTALSGGMQRKLSVILALCGNSKVVILDEPSSGMDPVARRGLWDLLISEKEGRTIMLTTHFMDEAEILGDRIAILAHGKLQCCGSSFFLKKKYGTGYRLTMDVTSECDSKKVTKLLSKHVPDVKMESTFGSELIYAISENHVPVFKKMFRDLEENGEGLGIKSFGISLATLEEVFMKVGTDHKQKKNEKVLNKDRENDNRDNQINQESLNVEITDSNLVKGCTLRSNQILAMLLKKDLIFLRHWVLFLVQIVVVIAFICLTMFLNGSSSNPLNEQKELKFDLEQYRSPITVISGENKYKSGYIRSLNDSNQKYYLTSNVSDYIFNLTKKNAQTVRSRYIIGATFHKNNSILAWFNNEPYHSPPLALKMAMDTIIRKELGQNASIEIINYPLPFTLSEKRESMILGSLGFVLASNLGTVMSIILGIYILFYIRERVIKFKLLQLLSVEACTFWFVTFLWDLLTYMIIAVCVILAIYAFQEDGYKTSQQIGVLFVIFLYSGFATLPIIYLFSLILKTDSGGLTAIFCFSYFIGSFAFLWIKIFKTLYDKPANIVHEVFLLLPPYSFCSGIDSSYDVYVTNKMCELKVDDCLLTGDYVIDECRNIICNVQEECCKVGIDYYKWDNPGILKHIVYSVSFGTFCIILLLLIDKNFFDCLLYNYKKKSAAYDVESTNDDSDVLDEKVKVRRMSGRTLSTYSLVLKDLTKNYKKITAVNNICVSVQSQECFGLLGLNGAGKTTTFKMMVGEIRMSQGDIWIYNNNLKQNRKKVQKCIGYCPQFDALLDELTGNETMMIFCLIKGIRRDECNYTIDRLSKALDFHKNLHKKVKQYSGGNKRKLNTAIAMIGEPSIIFLDEPTTGLDPGAKRIVWNEISRIRENGKCVILTSHSMEECEALCTRLAIMVNGEFKCIGSTQHLKSKFSEGYTLIIKIHKMADVAAYDKQMDIIEKFVKKNFPDAVVREKYQEMITYHIPNKNKSWSEMFEIMENNKSVLNLEDYSLSQPNLEQIFISVTKSQENQ